MANKENSNFKTALNELLAGKLTTEEPHTETAAAFAAPNSNENEMSFGTSFDSEKEFERIKKTAETIIAEDVVIEGSISSGSKLRILGEITGNVSSEGDIIVAGKIGGEIKGENIYLMDCAVNNNIISNGTVNVSEKSAVSGDIAALNITNSGVIKGNIKAENVVFKPTSHLTGDVSCKAIVIEKGATLKGRLETE